MLELTTQRRGSDVWVKLYMGDKERGALHSLALLQHPDSRTTVATTLTRAVKPDADLMVIAKVNAKLREAIARYK